ncbi:SUMF1/EgtB/PvdO family nonheme iron enzyme [Calothrix sp. FACHB-1219]|uniref:bifunctional serine/threonine-protein kinase/formylglycine-generating enzyme family protein n=1 Tax=unclassified Calothrix TaxID=2619626 RepID=UPI001683E474|nr:MULTISPECIES: bifunctional serine/threonine-protein kinase/formylglycine-generating enzyme family protein [unclassified Calothrix]MBD2203804.1 SUMF1/EgtB/PvdO family nonheme iron enzyme [Calothrix sp. FACHB-168]MBD2219622.1 SUMF1/EgtB/PvdO family nonheme iron enzyme [Calothrix sp. FACHB-1219]
MLNGAVLRNRYKIIKLLGSGGFGDTYLAEDLGIPINPKPKCVVKRLKTQNLTDEQLEWVKNSFEQEAATLYNLGNLHPQIPKLSEYFQVGNEFYLVQDFIDGDDFTKIITPGKNFPETTVIQLLAEILEVLVVVHQQNIIHRDINPKNIMRRRLDGKVILIDFGAVKQIMFQNSGQTSLTMGVGTPGFMPLEQFNGRPKLASDIYAIGMVGIQALTGIPPHLLDDDENGEVMWQNRVNISDCFAQVLTKMVSRRVTQRYQNATEALQAINLLNQPLAPTILAVPIPNQNTTTALALKSFQFEVVTVNATGKITNRQNREAKYFVENLGNGVTLEMVQIPGGTFIMGSPTTEAHRNNDESPQHQVTVPGFFMGKYPVTQAQYQAVMGGNIFQKLLGNNNNPSHFKGENRPVENVSWADAVEFCQKLSQKTGRTYRLPSEAEWEYACRAGTTTPFYFGDTITTDLVNYTGSYPYTSAPKGEYRFKTTPVGKFPPNPFGLYDMHGNIWEWCLDKSHHNYEGAPTDGSAWLSGNDNNYQLLRGGSWNNNAKNCRSASRNALSRAYRDNLVGFRVVAVARVVEVAVA